MSGAAGRLDIVGIDKHYGAFHALRDVSLSIGRGEFVTLLGPSGSGKTTLLRILAGFETVTGGQVLLDGRDITSLIPERRDFGLVFQGYALFPHMTVFDNVAYPLRVRRVPRAEIARRVGELLDLVQLSGLAGRRPAALSGGQQQRVALARALVFRPEVLLLDEPMSALDKKLRGDLQQELRDIHRVLGTTFVNVTHDQEEAMHMSDRIAIMNRGVIEQFGTPAALYRRPASRFVADFLGKSNILEGVLEAGAGGPCFRGGGLAFPVPGAGRSHGPVELMIRPEDAALGPAAATGGDVEFTARVCESTYSGDRTLYTLAAPGLDRFLVYSRAGGGAAQDIGATVTVSFPIRECAVIGASSPV
ncbi:ABC transporter ATP-binding protein [Zavarzinia aquatilis]|uniref:Polyamine ABC transporter ATP-binding protein n=1 Tax=Zavarzinia aquatilis TaxID=2211142 RepID=A0A317EDW2_9PROT|nr:ABC transporter ATP-binding protein [Zavarzinia aquatilis]PWR25227.1 polyamine ABC transporter ATP-binding protein [Zavarzinia aquatilis]